MATKKILRKVVKDGVEYEIEGQKVFIITEDKVVVSQDATKGVAPYSTSYGYTNIDINANAGIKWVEGAIYSFVVDTEMVVASAYRNVRVRIGNGAYIPMKNRANTILAGSSYMTKGRTQFFVYKTVYESGGALHLNVDTSYSAMSVAEGKTGTATSGRVVRADYLKQIIEYHAGNLDNELISGASYSDSWDGDTKAPTKNAVYDKITAMDTAIADKLDNPSGGNVGDVLTKTATGEEWQAPSGGGGSVDTETVNALIDVKLGNYDSLFSVSSGLYKILNDITDEDELGLTGGETWADIVSNSTSMSKISHGWTVMTMIANSSTAMNGILGDVNATKEISECWNSIEIISDNKLSSDLYLGSINGRINLFTYQTAQDAFFTSIEKKTEIISDNIMFIVNNNSILSLGYNDEIVENVIVSNNNAMIVIVGDSSKLDIVDDDEVIMGGIATNGTVLNEMSDNNFIEYILKNEDYMDITTSDDDGKARINSMEEDDLLPAVYYYTGDLGYDTFDEIEQDSEASATIQDNVNAMKIISCNDDAKSHFITEIYLGFDSEAEITEKGFTRGTYDRSGVRVSGGYLVTGGSNDSGGSIIYDVSQLDRWKFQVRMYSEGTSWGGDQHVSVGDGDFSGNGNLRNGNNPGHHLNMTTSSGYQGTSGIGTGTSMGSEYGQPYAGAWWVYEIEYNNGTYTMTRYNDTDEVTESSTYTHRVTYSGLGRAGNVGVWIRVGVNYQNPMKVDWCRMFCKK